MKRYPLLFPRMGPSGPSVLSLFEMERRAPGAPYPSGLGDVTAQPYYTEQQIKDRPDLLTICGEPYEVAG